VKDNGDCYMFLSFLVSWPSFCSCPFWVPCPVGSLVSCSFGSLVLFGLLSFLVSCALGSLVLWGLFSFGFKYPLGSNILSGLLSFWVSCSLGLLSFLVCCPSCPVLEQTTFLVVAFSCLLITHHAPINFLSALLSSFRRLQGSHNLKELQYDEIYKQ
jgi:hypothetical protein